MNKVEGSEVISVNISKEKGTKKQPVEFVGVIENFGIKGDSHAGNWHRQVSLLAIESIEKAQKWGLDVSSGDFAENITTEGINLPALPIGTKIKINDVVLEVTQIGKTCHDKCDIFKKVGKCIMPTEGIFTKVLKGGIIKKGDKISIKIISQSSCISTH
ncbi:MAG: MOSC domain-containing protein [Candidatus Altiarchaeales archaeon A3]|nr:MAG: MOSC domain-containing protein [Candidatus Altiarchaeales archaeon A3]